MSRRARDGFTLLEVLLALTLLVTASTLAWAWIANVTTHGRLTAARFATRRALIRVAAAMRDDLLGAVRDAEGRLYRIDAAGSLHCLTLYAPPGSPPGLHPVAWRYEPAGGRVLRVRSAPAAGPERPAGPTVARPCADGLADFACRIEGSCLVLEAAVEAEAQPLLVRLPCGLEPAP